MINRDSIIRMALEAGFKTPAPNDGFMGGVYDYREGTDTGASLEHFAALVAAKEREACAKVCENGVQNANDWDSSYWDQACESRAAAIRARSNNDD